MTVPNEIFYPLAGGVPIYPTASDLPSSAIHGSLAVTANTDSLYEFNGTSWIILTGGGGGGTVTSVGLSFPTSSIFNVGGSPVTGAGTLAVTYTNPGGNRLVGIDTIDGDMVYFTIGSGLTYTHSSHTLSATGGSGTVTNIATTAPLTGGPITTTGTLGITQSGVATNGFLSSTDWNTFNNKVSAPVYTANQIVVGDGVTAGGVTYPNLIWGNAQKSFAAGDLLAAGSNTMIQVTDSFKRAFIGRDTDSKGFFYYFTGASKLGNEQGFVADFDLGQLYTTITNGTTGTSKTTLSVTSSDFRFTDIALLKDYAVNLSASGLQLISNNIGWIWPTADGTLNQALVTDGAGNLSFADVGLPPVQFVAYGTTTTLTAPADVQVGNSGSGHTTVQLPTSGRQVGELYIIADFGANASAFGISISAGPGLIILDSQANTWQVFNNGISIYLRLVDNTPGAYVYKVEAAFNEPVNPSLITGTPTRIPYFDANTGALTNDANATRDNSNNFTTVIKATDGTHEAAISLQNTLTSLSWLNNSTNDEATLELDNVSARLKFNDVTNTRATTVTAGSGTFSADVGTGQGFFADITTKNYVVGNPFTGNNVFNLFDDPTTGQTTIDTVQSLDVSVANQLGQLFLDGIAGQESLGIVQNSTTTLLQGFMLLNHGNTAGFLGNFQGFWADLNDASVYERYYMGHTGAGNNNFLRVVNDFTPPGTGNPNCFEMWSSNTTGSSTIFTGAGLDDLTNTTIQFQSHVGTTYVITIDSTGGTDTFSWTDSQGGSATLVPITGAAQALSFGVTITFGATTGHTMSDSWTFNWNINAGRNFAYDVATRISTIGDVDNVGNRTKIISNDAGQSISLSTLGPGPISRSLGLSQIQDIWTDGTATASLTLHNSEITIAYNTGVITNNLYVNQNGLALTDGTNDFLDINIPSKTLTFGPSAFNATQFIIDDNASTYTFNQLATGGNPKVIVADTAGVISTIATLDPATVSPVLSQQVYGTNLSISGTGTLNTHVFYTTGTGAATVDISDPALPVRLMIILSDLDRISSTSNLTLDSGGGNTIVSTAGAAQTFVLNVDGGSVTVQKLNSNTWMVI